MSNTRFDRAATLHVFHPFARLCGRRRKDSLPILMYHGVGAPSRKGHPYYETSTSPEVFASQMKYLHEQGYIALELEAGLQAMFLGRSRGEKYVILTFDDGYRNVHSEALPILAEYGFHATVFLISGLVSNCRVNHRGHEYLTWSEVRELRANGVRFGSHTVTHPELHSMKEEQIEFEVSYSKETLEDRLGEPVHAFSYPFAFPAQDQRFTSWLRGLLEAYGYTCGVSTTVGTADPSEDWYFLPRLPINAYDDLRLLQAKLEGGYDWLRLPQKLYKSLQASRSAMPHRELSRL